MSFLHGSLSGTGWSFRQASLNACIFPRVLPDPKKEGGESARYSNVPEIMKQGPKVHQIQDDKCGQGTHNELWPLPPTATPLYVLWMQGLDMRSIEGSLDLDATNPA